MLRDALTIAQVRGATHGLLALAGGGLRTGRRRSRRRAAYSGDSAGRWSRRTVCLDGWPVAWDENRVPGGGTAGEGGRHALLALSLLAAGFALAFVLGRPIDRSGTQ